MFVRKTAYITTWLFVAAVPLDRMFIGDVIGADLPITITQIFGVIALLVAVIATLFEGRIATPNRGHLHIALFMVWACLSALWSLDPEASLGRVVTYVQLGFMVWLLGQYAQTRSEQTGFLVAYLCGTSFVVLQLFIGYILGGTVLSFEVFPGRYSSMGYNPNDLALTLALGIPFAWFVFTNTSGLTNLIAVAYMPAALAGVLLSASRGGAFAALVAASVVLFGFFKMSHLRKFVVAGAAVAAVVLAIIVVPERSWERLLTIDDTAETRWSTSGLDNIDVSNTRFAIWQEGLRVFQERPFIGIGVGGYLNVVDPVHGERRVAHNVFLSILVELGLVGLALFVVMTVVLVLSTRKEEEDERLMWLVVVLTYLVGGFFLSWEHTKQTWFVMGLIAARYVVVTERTGRKKAEIPNETKAVIARHIERQRWQRTRENAVEILLKHGLLDDEAPGAAFLQTLADADEEWTNVPDLALYLEDKLDEPLPDTVAGWKRLATGWEEELRRQLVSDF